MKVGVLQGRGCFGGGGNGKKESTGVLNRLFILIVDDSSPSANVRRAMFCQRAWYGMIGHAVNMCGNHIA